MDKLKEKIWKPENRLWRITALAAGLFMLFATSIWLLLNFWPALLFAAGGGIAFYLYRRSNSGISISEGLTISTEVLRSYVQNVCDEHDREIDPEIGLTGWGSNFTIHLNVEFPTDPEKASEFHSKIIYLKGHIARKMYDDFRVKDVRVEIEAVKPAVTSGIS